MKNQTYSKPEIKKLLEDNYREAFRLESGKEECEMCRIKK